MDNQVPTHIKYRAEAGETSKQISYGRVAELAIHVLSITFLSPNPLCGLLQKWPNRATGRSMCVKWKA